MIKIYNYEEISIDEIFARDIEDTSAIENIVKEAIAADLKSVADFKAGKEKALMALFGKCMKQLKGNANPQVLREILIAEINK